MLFLLASARDSVQTKLHARFRKLPFPLSFCVGQTSGFRAPPVFLSSVSASAVGVLFSACAIHA